MPNVLVTPTAVMKEIGRSLVNNLKFAANVNRSYDSQFANAGGKIGYTVNARLPERALVNKGQALVPQGTNDTIVPITLTDQANVGLTFSTASLTLEVDDYRKRYITPKVNALANTVDFDGLSRCYKDVYMTVGTPGVVPGSTGTLPWAANNVYGSAVTKLHDAAVPGPWMAMLTPAMHQYLVGANSALFHPSQALADNYRTGMFGSAALGVDEWFMDQNVATHVVGPLGGTPLIDGAAQTGTSIVTKGWSSAAASRLKYGDVIQLAGVYMINPSNYQSTGVLQDFSVQADFSSDASGNGSVSVKPGIITSGANQTVSASPADAAAITIFGSASAYANVSTRQALIYHMDAFALVFADLEVPGGLWVAEKIRNKALGIAIRFLKAYDIMTDQSPARVDILYGWKTVRPEMAARIAS